MDLENFLGHNMEMWFLSTKSFTVKSGLKISQVNSAVIDGCNGAIVCFMWIKHNGVIVRLHRCVFSYYEPRNVWRPLVASAKKDSTQTINPIANPKH